MTLQLGDGAHETRSDHEVGALFRRHLLQQHAGGDLHALGRILATEQLDEGPAGAAGKLGQVAAELLRQLARVLGPFVDRLIAMQDLHVGQMALGHPLISKARLASR